MRPEGGVLTRLNCLLRARGFNVPWTGQAAASPSAQMVCISIC